MVLPPARMRLKSVDFAASSSSDSAAMLASKLLICATLAM